MFQRLLARTYKVLFVILILPEYRHQLDCSVGLNNLGSKVLFWEFGWSQGGLLEKLRETGCKGRLPRHYWGVIFAACGVHSTTLEFLILLSTTWLVVITCGLILCAVGVPNIVMLLLVLLLLLRRLLLLSRDLLLSLTTAACTLIWRGDTWGRASILTIPLWLGVVLLVGWRLRLLLRILSLIVVLLFILLLVLVIGLLVPLVRGVRVLVVVLIVPRPSLLIVISAWRFRQGNIKVFRRSRRRLE